MPQLILLVLLLVVVPFKRHHYLCDAMWSPSRLLSAQGVCYITEVPSSAVAFPTGKPRSVRCLSFEVSTVSSRKVLFASLSFFLSVFLSGCAMNNVGAPSTRSVTMVAHIAGMVHGGQQPISGATIQLYATNTTTDKRRSVDGTADQCDGDDGERWQLQHHRGVTRARRRIRWCTCWPREAIRGWADR